MKHILAVCALALLLTACASRPPVPVVPEPEEAVAELEVIEPEIPLAERIHAPFAVQSSGQPAPRERRTAAVVFDTTAARPLAAAEAEADTVAAPAPRESRPAAGATTPPAAAAPRPATPAPTTPAATARAQPREHRVAPGETLMAIARRYDVSYTALLNSNPGIDPDRLRPDQVIRVPAGGTPPAAGGTPAASRPAATPAPARPQPAATRRTHTVAQGETLWSIARRYGVTVEQIRTANRMQDDTVRVGQTLSIPNG